MKEINAILKILNKNKLTYLDFLEIMNYLNDVQIDKIVSSDYTKLEYIENLKLLITRIYMSNYNISSYLDSLRKYISNILEKEKLDISSEIKKLDKYVYYFISFKFNNKIPYYYLSRKNIKLYLENFGKVYNYVPYILDDDRYDYFLINFAMEKNETYNLDKLLHDLKISDNVIKSYEYFSSDGLYNIKYLYKNKIKDEDIINDIKTNYMCNCEYKKIKVFESLVESYVEIKDVINLYKNIKEIKDENLLAIYEKHINNKDVKIFLVNGINKENIEKIKREIEIVFFDKNISSIFYKHSDFYGEQFLIYLKNKYNIHSSKY